CVSLVGDLIAAPSLHATTHSTPATARAKPRSERRMRTIMPPLFRNRLRRHAGEGMLRIGECPHRALGSRQDVPAYRVRYAARSRANRARAARSKAYESGSIDASSRARAR